MTPQEILMRQFLQVTDDMGISPVVMISALAYVILQAAAEAEATEAELEQLVEVVCNDLRNAVSGGIRHLGPLKVQ
jgi:hypothetical protein